jgi:hypothetical protein
VFIGVDSAAAPDSQGDDRIRLADWAPLPFSNTVGGGKFVPAVTTVRHQKPHAELWGEPRDESFLRVADIHSKPFTAPPKAQM